MPPDGSRLLTVLRAPWWPRILWLAVGVTGALSIGNALDGRSGAVRAVVSIGAWLLWGVGVVALVVPSTLGLVVTRMVSVLACAAAVASWATGAASAVGGVFVGCALVGAVVVGGAEFGQRCVQASAYGDERRFLLRPPAAFLLPIAVVALAWSAAFISAPLLLAAGQWMVGGAIAVIAVLLTWLLVPRFHMLARRWLVFVPAGVVVHDPIVLGETVMVPRRDVVAIGIALADTEAADFTGPAAGHAVEIGLNSMITALIAPTKAKPKGTAVHVQSFIVAPSRPGAVVRAAAGR